MFFNKVTFQVFLDQQIFKSVALLTCSTYFCGVWLVAKLYESYKKEQQSQWFSKNVSLALIFSGM